MAVERQSLAWLQIAVLMQNSLLFTKRRCLIWSIYSDGKRFVDGRLSIASKRRRVQLTRAICSNASIRNTVFGLEFLDERTTPFRAPPRTALLRQSYKLFASSYSKGKEARRQAGRVANDRCGGTPTCVKRNQCSTNALPFDPPRYRALFTCTTDPNLYHRVDHRWNRNPSSNNYNTITFYVICLPDIQSKLGNLKKVNL